MNDTESLENPPPAARLRGSNDVAAANLVDEPFGVHDVRTMRQTASAYAAYLGLPEPQITDLELITSELVTNAIQHGGGHGRLRLWATATTIYCQVSDDGPGMPPRSLPAAACPSASRGRGLWLVISSTDSLVVYSPPNGGTTVTGTINRSGLTDR